MLPVRSLRARSARHIGRCPHPLCGPYHRHCVAKSTTTVPTISPIVQYIPTLPYTTTFKPTAIHLEVLAKGYNNVHEVASGDYTHDETRRGGNSLATLRIMYYIILVSMDYEYLQPKIIGA